MIKKHEAKPNVCISIEEECRYICIGRETAPLRQSLFLYASCSLGCQGMGQRQREQRTVHIPERPAAMTNGNAIEHEGLFVILRLFAGDAITTSMLLLEDISIMLYNDHQ